MGGESANATLSANDLNDIFIKYGGSRTMTTMRKEKGVKPKTPMMGYGNCIWRGGVSHIAKHTSDCFSNIDINGRRYSKMNVVFRILNFHWDPFGI